MKETKVIDFTKYKENKEKERLEKQHQKTIKWILENTKSF